MSELTNAINANNQKAVIEALKKVKTFDKSTHEDKDELLECLQWAVTRKSPEKSVNEDEVVRKLIEDKKVPVDSKCFDDESTPLLIAFARRDLTLVNYLLDQGARADVIRVSGLYEKGTGTTYFEIGNTLLLYALKAGNIDLAQRFMSLLDNSKLDPWEYRCETRIDMLTAIGVRDSKHETPLMLAAAQQGCSKIAKDLIEVYKQSDSDIDEKNHDGNTALMLAVQAGNLETMYALLEAGADVGAKNVSGKTALSLAKEKMPELEAADYSEKLEVTRLFVVDALEVYAEYQKICCSVFDKEMTDWKKKFGVDDKSLSCRDKVLFGTGIVSAGNVLLNDFILAHQDLLYQPSRGIPEGKGIETVSKKVRAYRQIQWKKSLLYKALSAVKAIVRAPFSALSFVLSKLRRPSPSSASPVRPPNNSMANQTEKPSLNCQGSSLSGQPTENSQGNRP